MAKRKQPRDTGIIPSMGLTEQKRDELMKRDWREPPKKRNDEPANWTTRECADKRFSGIRINKLSRRTEMWANGKMLADESTSVLEKDPGKLASLHERAFLTTGTLVSVDVTVKRMPPNAKAPKSR
jgi:hypothetical protein